MRKISLFALFFLAVFCMALQAKETVKTTTLACGEALMVPSHQSVYNVQAGENSLRAVGLDAFLVGIAVDPNCGKIGLEGFTKYNKPYFYIPLTGKNQPVATLRAAYRAMYATTAPVVTPTPASTPATTPTTPTPKPVVASNSSSSAATIALNKANEKAQNLSAANSLLRKENEELNRKLQAFSGANNAAKEALKTPTSGKKQDDTLQREVATLRQQIVGLQEELDRLKEENSKLKASSGAGGQARDFPPPPPPPPPPPQDSGEKSPGGRKGLAEVLVAIFGKPWQYETVYRVDNAPPEYVAKRKEYRGKQINLKPQALGSQNSLLGVLQSIKLAANAKAPSNEVNWKAEARKMDADQEANLAYAAMDDGVEQNCLKHYVTKSHMDEVKDPANSIACGDLQRILSASGAKVVSQQELRLGSLSYFLFGIVGISVGFVVGLRRKAKKNTFPPIDMTNYAPLQPASVRIPSTAPLPEHMQAMASNDTPPRDSALTRLQRRQHIPRFSAPPAHPPAFNPSRRTRTGSDG